MTVTIDQGTLERIKAQLGPFVDQYLKDNPDVVRRYRTAVSASPRPKPGSVATGEPKAPPPEVDVPAAAVTQADADDDAVATVQLDVEALAAADAQEDALMFTQVEQEVLSTATLEDLGITDEDLRIPQIEAEIQQANEALASRSAESDEDLPEPIDSAMIEAMIARGITDADAEKLGALGIQLDAEYVDE